MGTFLHSLSPLPSNFLFIAFGVSRVKVLSVLAGFALGRLISYATLVYLSHSASTYFHFFGTGIARDLADVVGIAGAISIMLEVGRQIGEEKLSRPTRMVNVILFCQLHKRNKLSEAYRRIRRRTYSTTGKAYGTCRRNHLGESWEGREQGSRVSRGRCWCGQSTFRNLNDSWTDDLGSNIETVDCELKIKNSLASCSSSRHNAEKEKAIEY